eukprot:scaffold12_cov337-Prasinococcus_capsulatus_cf.AAC.2
MRAWVRLVLSKAVWIVLVATGPYTPSGTRSMKPVLQMVVQVNSYCVGLLTGSTGYDCHRRCTDIPTSDQWIHTRGHVFEIGGLSLTYHVRDGSAPIVCALDKCDQTGRFDGATDQKGQQRPPPADGSFASGHACPPGSVLQACSFCQPIIAWVFMLRYLDTLPYEYMSSFFLLPCEAFGVAVVRTVHRSEAGNWRRSVQRERAQSASERSRDFDETVPYGWEAGVVQACCVRGATTIAADLWSPRVRRNRLGVLAAPIRRMPLREASARGRCTLAAGNAAATRADTCPCWSVSC